MSLEEVDVVLDRTVVAAVFLYFMSARMFVRSKMHQGGKKGPLKGKKNTENRRREVGRELRGKI